MNFTAVSGNFGFDPEFKVSKNGTPIFSGSLCVKNRSRKKTNYIDIVAFNNMAENMSKILKKGSFLIVEDAELDMDEQVDDSGKKRRKLKLIVNRCDFGPKVKESDVAGDDMPDFTKDSDGF